MFWLLNYIPLLFQIVLHITPLISKLQFNLNFGIYMILYLFITPLYLLLVNFYYLKLSLIPYKISCIYMLSVVLLDFVVFLVIHKIKYGTFIGDIPEGLCILMIVIPVAIILLGILIHYCITHR